MTSPVSPETTQVLVVDDNPSVLGLLHAVLSAEGYQVHQAKSGEIAIEYAVRMPQLDLLITDMQMPGLSGYEVAKEIKSRFSELKTLFISGFTEMAHEVAAEVLQARALFLSKPFTPAQLLAAADQVLTGKAKAAGLEDPPPA